jgi:7-cyano-7-deazaguanine reductase
MISKSDYLDFFEKYIKGNKMEDLNREKIKKFGEMLFELVLSQIVTIPYAGNLDEEVTYESEELTALCPVTAIQDYYKIKINFIPNKLVPELKSLKYYFLSFRDIPVSHENMFAKIYKDFVNIITPKKIEMYLDCSIRGGIKTTIKYSHDYKGNKRIISKSHIDIK